MKGRSLLPLAIALFAMPASYAQTDPGQMKPVAYKVVDGNKVDNDTLQGWKNVARARVRTLPRRQAGRHGRPLADRGIQDAR